MTRPSLNYDKVKALWKEQLTTRQIAERLEARYETVLRTLIRLNLEPRNGHHVEAEKTEPVERIRTVTLPTINENWTERFMRKRINQE